jgi:hypothetical protein
VADPKSGQGAHTRWLAMREEWDLPADALIKPTGKEWLLQLLNAIPTMQRACTMMTLWRIWHNHNNELTHDKPCPSIEGSRRFLVSYLSPLKLGGTPTLLSMSKALGERSCHVGTNEMHGFTHIHAHTHIHQIWK